jgi:hypothetical protein
VAPGQIGSASPEAALPPLWISPLERQALRIAFQAAVEEARDRL